MKAKTERVDVGIIVGRFNVHELHQAHIDLIQTVIDNHDRVIIFLGNSVIRNTARNPLDFRSRQAMILETFPNIEIHYVKDNQSNEVWSKNLDKQISEIITPSQTVLLYGSRDSFLRCYSGKYDTVELESKIFISGTELRRKVMNNYPPTKDYRAGMIAATGYRHPTAYQTVDVAVVNQREEVLVARKPDEKKWRFIGGFSDPLRKSLEEDVTTEVQEEAGIEIGDINYIGSTIVEDWRYRAENDKIKTAFFVAKYVFGSPQGGDDVAEVQWVKITKLDKNQIELVHHPLVDIFVEKFVKNKELYKKLTVVEVSGSMT